MESMETSLHINAVQNRPYINGQVAFQIWHDKIEPCLSKANFSSIQTFKLKSGKDVIKQSRKLVDETKVLFAHVK